MEMPLVESQRQAVEILEDLLGKVKSGSIISICCTAECTDGTFYMAASSTENVYGMAGYMINNALVRMGFVEKA